MKIKTTMSVLKKLKAGVGSVLEGDEGHGPTRIKITAIGEDTILAKDMTHKGTRSIEGMWDLRWREWKLISFPKSSSGRRSKKKELKSK